MLAKQVVDGLYAVDLMFVNVFLLRGPDGWVLIDTGMPKSEKKILQALAELGAKPSDLRHIVLTHAHPDHIGSAAALKRATGAAVSIHAMDAPIARAGTGFRPMQPAPGILSKLFAGVMHRMAPKAVEPVAIDSTIEEGEPLAFANGMLPMHAPGHCAGQLTFLLPVCGGVLVAADACGHLFNLNLTIMNEDTGLSRRSLKRLAALQFDTAVFGHGKPLIGRAGAQFRAKFA